MSEIPKGSIEDFDIYYSQTVSLSTQYMSNDNYELDIYPGSYEGGRLVRDTNSPYMVFVHKTLTPSITSGSGAFRLYCYGTNSQHTGIYLAGQSEGGSGDYVDGIFMGVQTFWNSGINLYSGSLNASGSAFDNASLTSIGVPPTPNEYYYIECTWAENGANVDVTVKLYDKTYTTQIGSTHTNSIPSTEWVTNTAGFLAVYPLYLDSVKLWV